MILKPCPFCRKEIPRAITVCPYCRRDEQGKTVDMETSRETAAGVTNAAETLEKDLEELASADHFVREQAIVRIGQKGSSVVPPLITILQQSAKPGLAGIAKALGLIGDRRAIPALALAVKIGDEDLRTAAVAALGRFHEPEAVLPILAEAERPHPIVQSYSAYILGTKQDERVLPVLGRLMKNTAREVAFQAAYALGELGDKRAVPLLRRGLRHKDPMIRIVSQSSLMRLGVRASPWRGWSLGVWGIVLLVFVGIAVWWVQR